MELSAIVDVLITANVQHDHSRLKYLLYGSLEAKRIRMAVGRQENFNTLVPRCYGSAIDAQHDIRALMAPEDKAAMLYQHFQLLLAVLAVKESELRDELLLQTKYLCKAPALPGEIAWALRRLRDSIVNPLVLKWLRVATGGNEEPDYRAPSWLRFFPIRTDDLTVRDDESLSEKATEELFTRIINSIPSPNGRLPLPTEHDQKMLHPKPVLPPEAQVVTKRLIKWSLVALAMRQALLNPGLKSDKLEDVVRFIEDNELLPPDRSLERQCDPSGGPERKRQALRARKRLRNTLQRVKRRMHEMGDYPVRRPHM